MTIWNLPSLSDNVFPSKVQGIFIYTEFGVTFSDKNNLHDSSETPISNGITETTVTKLHSTRDYGLIKDPSFTSLSKPCMTPLILSVPFDGDEQDLRKMTFYKPHDTLRQSIYFENETAAIRQRRMSFPSNNMDPNQKSGTPLRDKESNQAQKMSLVTKKSQPNNKYHQSCTKFQAHQSLEYVLYPGNPKIHHNYSLPKSRRPVLCRNMTIF